MRRWTNKIATALRIFPELHLQVKDVCWPVTIGMRNSPQWKKPRERIQQANQIRTLRNTEGSVDRWDVIHLSKEAVTSSQTLPGPCWAWSWMPQRSTSIWGEWNEGEMQKGQPDLEVLQNIQVRLYCGHAQALWSKEDHKQCHPFRCCWSGWQEKCPGEGHVMVLTCPVDLPCWFRKTCLQKVVNCSLRRSEVPSSGSRHSSRTSPWWTCDSKGDAWRNLAENAAALLRERRCAPTLSSSAMCTARSRKSKCAWKNARQCNMLQASRCRSRWLLLYYRIMEDK